MDLGKDSLVLCLHCPQTLWTLFELLVICFLFKTFGSGSRSQSASQEDSCREFCQSVCQLYSWSGPFLVSSHPGRTPVPQRGYRQCGSSNLQARLHLEPNSQTSSNSQWSLGWACAPLAKLVRQSLPHTTLFACTRPGPEHLDMHWFQPRK